VSRDYVLKAFRAPIELSIDYPGELNAQQLAAVTAPPGPSLVIAGAGSGKTRVLTYRVAYLLEQGIPADRMLLLTFTNKAAKEMMRRVGDLLGQELPELWGGTFHSIGNRILRQHAGRLGFERDFSILDRDDAKAIIKACISEAGIDAKAGRFPKPEVLAEVFSLSVNTHKTVPQVIGEHYEYFSTLTPTISALAQRYAEKKRATNGMDFDDLLTLWLRLLQENAEICEQYQRRFQFILVDEYQDTNRLQSDLIDLMAARSKNVMVVGDDAQSIYAWRGADFQNILQFPKRYPGASVFKIETNYRSTPEILQVANAAIAANVNQFAKELAPSRNAGEKPALVACEDAAQQAAFVAQRVLELHEEGKALGSMAVLYRSHFHALELQLELTRQNIPFAITSGIRFFEQAHIKDVTAYIKFVTNPRDELSFKRLAELLPGVGGKGADRLWKLLEEELKRPDQDKGSPGTDDAPPEADSNALAAQLTTSKTDAGLEAAMEGAASLAKALQACSKAAPKKSGAAWTQFLHTILQLEAPDIRSSAAKMIQLVIDAGYDEHLKENYDNHEVRLDDLKQLAVFARQFANVTEFLTQLALLTNVESEEDRPDNKNEDSLKLSTVHQAKGLEFDIVFVIMLCDGLFPSGRSVDFPEGEEEERRLFYVAVTRARNQLYLSYPLLRRGFAGDGGDFQQPSRFLGEIPPELVEEWNLQKY
jgi:DNA helicase-2/ATP-dependent DNA helicase PcrA